MNKYKGSLIILLLLLTGCGYQITDTNTNDVGVTTLKIDVSSIHQHSIDRICKKNKDENSNTTNCEFTAEDGTTGESSVDNSQYQIDSQVIEGDISQQQITTNVYDKTQQTEYCQKTLEKEVKFTNCTFTMPNGEANSKIVANPELYTEIKYMGFNQSQVTTFDGERKQIASYDLEMPDQMIITPRYIYFHTKTSNDLATSDEYQAFDLMTQQFIGQVGYKGPSYISYSNNNTYVSKALEKEVCKLDGIVESDCFSTTSDMYAEMPTDAWNDGEGHIYVLVTDGSYTTSLLIFDENGENKQSSDEFWQGAATARFYEFEEGNPLVYTPNSVYPGEMVLASFNVPLSQIVGNPDSHQDFYLNEYKKRDKLSEYPIFSINHPAPESALMAWSSDIFNVNELGLASSRESTEGYVVQHPFYVDYSTNHFGDFYTTRGLSPTFEYSYLGDELCETEFSQNKSGFKLSCGSHQILDYNQTAEYDYEHVVAL